VRTCAAPCWHAVYGLPVLVFRFFNVFGPDQRADYT
jgi:nucleoside-diphosphate-sugar epimerase